MNEQDVLTFQKNDDITQDVGNTSKFVSPPAETIVTYHPNKDIEVITIPQERLEIYARDYELWIARKSFVRCLSGLFLTLLVVVVTADFKDAIFLTGAEWKALFKFSLFLTFIALFFRLDIFSKVIIKIKFLLPSEFEPDLPVTRIRNTKEFVNICKEGKYDTELEQ